MSVCSILTVVLTIPGAEGLGVGRSEGRAGAGGSGGSGLEWGRKCLRYCSGTDTHYADIVTL